MLLLTIIFLNIISILFLLFGVVHCILTNEVFIFAPSLLLFFFNIILFMFYFSKYISSFKITINTYNFFNFKNDENVEIVVHREKEKFIATYKNKQILFESDIPFFKKGMFIAYIVRNVRFKEVSNKMPLGKLFKSRLELKNTKTKEMILNINGKKITIVKNGVSLGKYSFINKSFYFKELSYRRIITNHISRTICIINEQIFEKGQIIFGKNIKK